MIADHDKLCSVLFVWMIISLRRIFVSCLVVMLSIKLALMSGYKPEGIIVLLAEQRYVQKAFVFHAIFVSFLSFCSRA